MTNPVQPMNGEQFYLQIGDGAGSEVFSFLCVFTTISSKHSITSDDAWLPDRDDPTLIASRASAAKGVAWDITGSGLADPNNTAYKRLRTLFSSRQPGNFKLIKTPTGAETEQGSFLVTDLSEDMADKGFVRISATLKGNGYATVTPNS